MSDANGPRGEIFTDCRGLGDVDGDGYGDVSITIGYWVHVFYGGPGGIQAGRSERTQVNLQNGLVTTW